MIKNIPGISFIYSFMDLFVIVVAVVCPKDIQLGNRVQSRINIKYALAVN